MRQKQGGHSLDREFAMALLEDGPHIDHGVDVRFCRGVSSDRQSLGFCEKRAERAQLGGRSGGVFGVGEGEEPPAAIRLDHVAQVNRPGVGQTDDRAVVQHVLQLSRAA